MEFINNKVKICVVGAGNIGSAMALGLAKSGVHVSVYNRSEGRLKALAGIAGLNCTTSLPEALEACDIALICVEGDAVLPVARSMVALFGHRPPMVGSCAAAISMSELSEALTGSEGERPAVFRLLPNIAATVRRSAYLLCGS